MFAVIDARSLTLEDSIRLYRDKWNGLPEGALCGAVVKTGSLPSLRAGTAKASTTDIGIPGVSGRSIVVSVDCAPAIASRGLPADERACPNTYAWSAGNGSVRFNDSDCAKLEAARHCPDYPLFVTTEHGLVHVEHGNPLTRMGVANSPTFLLKCTQELERKETPKSKDDLQRAYTAHRKNVTDCLAKGIDECVANGASGIFVHPIDGDACPHSERVANDFKDIVSEIMDDSGQTGEPRRMHVHFCIIKNNRSEPV